jgi:hypothetical protein
MPIKHRKPANYKEIKSYVEGRIEEDREAALKEAVTLALDTFYSDSDDTTLCGLALAMRDPYIRDAMIAVMFTATHVQAALVHHLLVSAYALVPRKQAYGVEVALWAHEWHTAACRG